MKHQRVPLWVPGDWNAFFGLGTNSLLNLLVLTGLLLGVVQMPASLVFGRILPAIGIMLFITNVYYAYMARRLAIRTGRTDVTALPSGPSVPHMFIVVLVVMLPVRLATGDPIRAWQAGLAWVFIAGLINLTGAFIAPYIRRVTPRAALLGTLAGVSVAFIAMAPTMEIFLTPWIGLISLAIIFGGWFAGVRFPFQLPAGLVAIAVGTVLGWATGMMTIGPLRESFIHFGLHLPFPVLDHLLAGFGNLAPLLVTAIPFGVYDFIEAMDNVESAEVAGDSYSVREVLLVEGGASLIGTLLGSPFANAVYIGHPGWKEVGGRIGYAVATGIMVIMVTLFGIIPLLLSVIPLVAILPILLYIGALIGAQAFQATPRAHAPAIVLALVPHFAAWGRNLVDSALSAAGTSAAAVGPEALAGAGVLYDGLAVLGGGAIVSGLVLAAIVVFLIDHRFNMAAAYAAVGAVLAFFGFIHGPAIGFGVSPGIALGYLMMAGLCLGFKYLPVTSTGAEEPSPVEPVELHRAAGEAVAG
jgi:adenine/guanine/hypoxanthine permease